MYVLCVYIYMYVLCIYIYIHLPPCTIYFEVHQGTTSLTPFFVFTPSTWKFGHLISKVSGTQATNRNFYKIYWRFESNMLFEMYHQVLL